MGKPGWGHAQSLLPEHIGQREGTGETETSKYPEEEKTTCDSLSSGERNGKSLNRAGGKAWWRCQFGVVGADRGGTRPFTELQSLDLAEAVWNTAPKTVRAPYAKDLRPPVGFPE